MAALLWTTIFIFLIVHPYQLRDPDIAQCLRSAESGFCRFSDGLHGKPWQDPFVPALPPAPGPLPQRWRKCFRIFPAEILSGPDKQAAGSAAVLIRYSVPMCHPPCVISPSTRCTKPIAALRMMYGKIIARSLSKTNMIAAFYT